MACGAWVQANPWLSLGPGLAILITVPVFNLSGDGLRDALDPRLK
jgi:ABC-type dipeptide/oligopeptide/nickel transport system permease subunit